MSETIETVMNKQGLNKFSREWSGSKEIKVGFVAGQVEAVKIVKTACVEEIVETRYANAGDSKANTRTVLL